MQSYKDLAQTIYERTQLWNFGNYASKKEQGYEFPTEIDRLCFLVVSFHGEVSSGGFLTFFVNGGGDYVDDILACLETIGDGESIAMLREVLPVYKEHRSVIEGGSVFRMPDRPEFAGMKELSMRYWERENDDALEYLARYLKAQGVSES